MVTRIVKSKATRAAVAVAMVAGVFAVAGQTPTGAAPQSKTLTASCQGKDPAKDGPLIGALGGAPSLPIQINSDVPPTLKPEENGSPISFTIGVNLTQDLINKAAPLVKGGAIGIKNVEIGLQASGPGLAKPIDLTAPVPDQTLTLAVGQPAGTTLGPFTGTLTGVKKGGLIKYSATKLNFTISADTAAIGVVNVNLVCSAPGTAATTRIPIPGAPVIEQPFSLNAVANQKTTVDLLGKFVKKGTTEDGRQLEVDPASLKVLEGPAVVENGAIAITTPTSASVIVEVCATEKVAGANEVQRITLDTSPEGLKKGVAFTLKSGDEVTKPIDLVGPITVFGAILGGKPAFVPSDANPADPQVWKNNANSYIPSTFELPTPAEIKAALEGLPSVGAGGVEVFTTNKGDLDKLNQPLGAGVYDVVFTPKDPQKNNVPTLTIGNWWSVFPQEVKNDLLNLANNLPSGGGSGGGSGPTIPEGLTAKAYAEQLQLEFQAALVAGNTDLAGQKLSAFGALIPSLLIDEIKANIDQVLAFIENTFTKVTPPATKIDGETPTDICQQGVIDVNVAAVAATPPTGGPPQGVAGISASRTGGSSLAFTG